jgi:nucleotide-binding universal stress UspA family protein
MKRILVPTDFSKQATFALNLAYEMAQRANAEILLAHVVELPSSSSISITGEVRSDDMAQVFILKLIESSKRRIQEIAQSEKYQGVTIRTKVEIGSPYVKLSSMLTETEVDLIIMGTQGSSGLDEVFIGSNAEKMVRYAKVPVICIKRETHLANINDIVFATDMKGNLDTVVAQLKDLAETLDAKLHLLKINTPNNFIPSRVIKKNMKDFIAKYQLTGATINIYSDVDEEDGIMYFAEENNMDMIAMGTRGRKGLMHLLSGSIAEDVVNHAKRPVWTMKI